MAFGDTIKDLHGVPMAQVYVPNVGFIAMAGLPSTTDSSSNASTSGLLTIGGPPATDPYYATVFAAGEMRVQEEPTQLFHDDFGTGTLDTTNRWKSPTASGGGVAASNAVGDTVLGTGTTANGYSYLESVTTFTPRNPGWNQFQASVNLPSPYIANTYFFLGLGTSPATPTAAAPLTNAAGFEVAVGGKMYAVCYASGTRNVIQDLSSGTGNGTQPTDSAVHIYTLFFRGDRAYWSIDGLDNVVASMLTGANGPNVNTLPVKFTAIAGTSAPASNGQITVNQVFMADTTRQNVQLSDGTFPWRKAQIDALGNLYVATGLYNGSTIDQQRNNQDNITLLTSAAITSNGNTADLVNYNAKGVKVYIKTGSFGSSESTMTVTIQIKDPVGGTYYSSLVSASLSASTTYVLTVYPGITVTTNVSANDVIPRTWRVAWSAANWGSGGSTLGISCAYII